MSILSQLILAERYGLRLNIAQLATELGIEKRTLYNQISAGTCPVPTYVDGGHRWADVRDVAGHFDTMRAAARAAHAATSAAGAASRA